MNRDVSITYNGLTLGGTSTVYRLDGPFAFEIGRDTISLEAAVLVTGTTEANLLSNEASLINTFKGAKGSLVVMLGASTRYTFSHSGNTGMNAQAKANKAGSDIDSGLAARYTVSVLMERPWDYSGDNGLRNASISCQTGTNDLRTLVISGQYSATSGSSAKTNHDNDISTISATWLSTFGILNSDLIEKYENPDKENKFYDFRRTYVEVGFAKTTATTNPSTFKDPRLNVFFDQREFGSHSQDARLPVQCQVSYSAVVVFTNPTSLTSPNDLKQFIITNLDPKIYDYLRRVTPTTGPICTLSRKPTYDPFTNSVSVTYEFLIYPSSLIEIMVDVTEEADEGISLTPVWDGNEFSREEQPAPRDYSYTVNIMRSYLYTGVILGFLGAEALEALKNQATGSFPGSEFRLVRRRRNRRRVYQGLVGKAPLAVMFEDWTLGYIRVNKPKDGKPGQNVVPSGLLREGAGSSDQGGAKPADTAPLTRPQTGG